MCNNYPTVFANGGSVSNPKVPVEDLWAVFPELKQGTPEEFIRKIEQAAKFSRQHEAFHDLRDNFESEAVGVVLESFPTATIDFGEEDEPGSSYGSTLIFNSEDTDEVGND